MITPMVGILANGTTAALAEAKLAFGWAKPGDDMACPIHLERHDVESEWQPLVDRLVDFGLSVEVYQAAPEVTYPSGCLDEDNPFYGVEFAPND